ncbi:hypothetical protein AAHE18_20G008900 [Arachis hypogaea]
MKCLSTVTIHGVMPMDSIPIMLSLRPLDLSTALALPATMPLAKRRLRLSWLKLPMKLQEDGQVLLMDHMLGGYCFLQENTQSDYCSPSAQWPCAPGKKYYGRGPIQISYNYNYGPAGRAIGVDLLNNPDLVATDPVISFKTAIWFWMTPQGNKPSSHDVITGRWTPSDADRAAGRVPGYGVITNIINGGLECGHGPDARVEDRIGFFRRYCQLLGVSPGDNLDCNNQRSFNLGIQIANS